MLLSISINKACTHSKNKIKDFTITHSDLLSGTKSHHLCRTLSQAHTVHGPHQHTSSINSSLNKEEK